MTKVLVVEDDMTLLESITFELGIRGYEVLGASNGREALHFMRTCEQPPDLIISDIAMPDLDGFQLLERVRNEIAWNGIPFLFVTAFDSVTSLRTSKAPGGDDYIIKPFKMDDLVITMENKLKRIQAFRQAAEQQLDDTRRQLLHMMSHELRTPMTAIYGGSEMLADHLGSTSDELVQSMLNLIQNGAHRMNRLTAKALALIELDSGQLKSLYKNASRRYDMGEIVSAAKTAVETEAELADRNVITGRLFRVLGSVKNRV